MATGCCGVKKQKLSSAVIATTNGSYMRNSNNHGGQRGFLANGSLVRSSEKTNGTVSNSNDDRGSAMSSPSSNYVGPEFSRVSVRRNPRVICVDMVVFCFDVLYSYLHSADPPKSPKFTNDHFPLFVTWKMGKDKKLRGCIGTFNSTSLHQGLREYAITSACKDSRFDPIHVDEFARLHCSVSLLMDFEVADHYLDWEIGMHGIRIEFCTEKGSKKAATYLPEVAIEQGWNQIQTIDSLLRKGGFKGTITPEIRGNICLIRFQSEKLTVSYTEYVLHKQQRPTTANGYHQNHNHFQEMSSTISPPMKSPTLNGGTESRNNFMDRSLPAISGSAGHYRNQHMPTYHNRHGHSTSTHSVTSAALNDGTYEHRLSTPGTRGGNYWRNHNRSNSGSRRSPVGEGDSQRQMSSVNITRYLTLPTHHTYMPPPGL